ncbi:NAD(P)/FAD-dependent oxidoreductase [Parasphingorhabdus sp.]|uniref:flavin-containing monooxygenase n=1 Tax=Parasphingorhabdus sp. TaxID=2709688 RepID=UPI002F95B069
MVHATDEIPVYDVLIIGAGFAGLHSLHRVRSDGFNAIVIEAAPDVGGAWYWNRYPGARCDVESLVYSYSFSPILDAEWKWSERYSARDEICEYLRFAADRLDLRKDIRFNSRIKSAIYDKQARLWEFETEDGDRYKARHFISAAGPITTPIYPDIPGIKSFKGTLIHTARWPQEEPDFSGKRVGIIGTGSSAVQAIPIIAEQCEHLTVFIRTANFYSPACNRPLTDADYEWWEENRELTRERMRECIRWGGGDIMLPDEVNDTALQKASDFSPERRAEIYETRYANGGGVVGWAFGDAMVDPEVNQEAGDFLRSKIATVVEDPDTVEKLTPRGFAYGTKRCTVGTDYYEAYNRENVDLVDVKSNPIEYVEDSFVVVGGEKIELDYLICASGFDALTGALTGMEVRGEDGQLLKDVWQDGPKTELGISVHGFPNLYMVGGPGSPSVLTNVVMTNEIQVDWIGDLIKYVEDNDFTRCEAKQEAQEQWTDTVNSLVEDNLWGTSNSWYVGANVPGKPRVILAYVGGVKSYREHCDQESQNGYPGFALS